MTKNRREALRLLRAYTGGTFDVSKLTGPAKATARQHVLSALKMVGGNLPKSKCTVSALREALAEFCEGATCRADEPAKLREAFESTFPVM